MSEAPEVAAPPQFLTEHDRRLRVAAANPKVISFAGGLPDPALFPRRELTRAFIDTVNRRSCAGLQYGWPEGSAQLRCYVAERLVERGAHVEPDQVVITSGAQQAIFVVLHAALRRGATIGFEDESYPGALDAARAFGARLADIDEPANAYYLMPSLSNPRGCSLAAGARSALLLRARNARAYLIEDDAYAETRFSASPLRPLLADAPERVFHIGTLSKTLCPGLRVGWVVPPKRFLRRILRAKQNNDLQANGLSQALVEGYLSQGGFEAHKQRARRNYRRRARRLSRALRHHLPWLRFDEPEGGFSLWLATDLHSSEEAVFDAAVREGVSLDMGRAFCRVAPKKLSFRLCYSAVPEREIEEGVQRLARALQRVA